MFWTDGPGCVLPRLPGCLFICTFSPRAAGVPFYWLLPSGFTFSSSPPLTVGMIGRAFAEFLFLRSPLHFSPWDASCRLPPWYRSGSIRFALVKLRVPSVIFIMQFSLRFKSFLFVILFPYVFLLLFLLLILKLFGSLLLLPVIFQTVSHREGGRLLTSYWY